MLHQVALNLWNKKPSVVCVFEWHDVSPKGFRYVKRKIKCCAYFWMTVFHQEASDLWNKNQVLCKFLNDGVSPRDFRFMNQKPSVMCVFK